MTAVYVQFSDASQKTVVAVFGCQQDQTAYPNQAIIDAGDARYQAFVNPTSTLPGAQAAQIAALATSYLNAIQQPVSYTSKGGITKTYQADPQSIANLSQMLLAFQATGTVPSGFYWIAADNTQVPFAYADMQGLAQVMGTQGATAFQKFQGLKAQVSTSTTMAGVQSVTWS